MPHGRHIFALMVFASSITLLSCGGDDSAGDGGDSGEIAAARVAASDAALATSSLIEGAVAGMYGVPSGKPEAARLDEFGLTCPDITVGIGQFVASVTLNYGTGCTSQLDERVHSGSIGLLVTLAGTFSTTFDSYVVDDYGVNGTVQGTLAPGRADIAIQTLGLSRPGTTASVSGTVGVTTENGGTPASMLDDTFTTTLALLLNVDSGSQAPGLLPEAARPAASESYSITSSPEDPVVFKVGCMWPVSGTITITRETQVWPRFDVDFGDGTCDATATLLLPGREPQEITLGH